MKFFNLEILFVENNKYHYVWRRRSRAVLYNISGNIGNITSTFREQEQIKEPPRGNFISNALGRSVIQLATYVDS